MTDSVHALFDRYAAALGAGDLPAIADCYATPALVLAEDASVAVADGAAVQSAFRGAMEAYRAKGLVAARPTVTDVEPLTDRLVMCAVEWEYVDAQGGAIPGEAYRYLVRDAADGARICVVIPTD